MIYPDNNQSIMFSPYSEHENDLVLMWSKGVCENGMRVCFLIIRKRVNYISKQSSNTFYIITKRFM